MVYNIETVRLKIKKELYIKPSLVGKGVSHIGTDEQFWNHDICTIRSNE